MMNKTELNQYINRKITTAEAAEINDYTYVVKSITKGNMNIHYVYDAKFISECDNLAKTIVFETKDEVLQFVRTQQNTLTGNTLKEKWTDARISNNYYFENYNGYVLDTQDYDNGAKSLLGSIEQRQVELKRLQLENKHNNEKSKIDKVMKTVPKLPSQFDKWVQEKVFQDYSYMYYKKSGKIISGYCTSCNSEVTLSSALHNEHGKCPKCKVRVEFKAEGKSKNISATTWFYIVQKAGENLVIRGFVGTKTNGADYKNPQYRYDEQLREFISPKGEYSVYEMNYYKNTLDYRWCDGIKYSFGNRWSKDAFMHSGSCYVYSRNLSSVIKNTVWQYSGLVEFMKHMEYKGRPCSYLIDYLKHPVIESLSKVGLVRMVKQIINSSYLLLNEDFDLTKSNFVEALKLKKRWIKQIIEMNIDFSELRTYRTLMEIYSFTDSKGEIVEPTYSSNQLKLVVQRFNPTTLKMIHDRNISITKACNYTTKQLKLFTEEGIKTPSPTEVGRLWYDYLDMTEKTTTAARLANRDIEEFPLFPKNIKQAHDEAMETFRDTKFEIHNHNIKQRSSGWDKYVYSNEKYTMVLPKDAYDLINESNALKHCVKLYADRVADGRTLILFVRDNENLDKPLYTLEYSEKKLEQVQFKGKSNSRPEDQAIQFVTEWEAVIKDRLLNAEKSKFDNQWKEMSKKNNTIKQEVKTA